jgi:voltage-gated potassium channel
MTAWRRLATGGVLFLSLLGLGTVGYILIEGWSFLDALYMTITTVTTVGFREIRPLDTGGRIFTIILVLFGVGAAFYILTALVQTVVEGELGLALGVRRMKGKIESLRDHYVLCGFGRVGEEICREFMSRRIPFVIVESNSEALGRARAKEYLVVEGDASTDAVLIGAGVERASCLLAASDSDSGNTYITLTAKAINPELFVVARVGKPANEEKLRRAGADRVISPYLIGGRRMALSALQPTMVDFMDTLVRGHRGEQIMVELEVMPDSALAGSSLREALNLCKSVTVLGLHRKTDGSVIVGPRPDEVLAAGDRLMVLGDEEDLERLNQPLAAPAV